MERQGKFGVFVPLAAEIPHATVALVNIAGHFPFVFSTHRQFGQPIRLNPQVAHHTFPRGAVPPIAKYPLVDKVGRFVRCGVIDAMIPLVLHITQVKGHATARASGPNRRAAGPPLFYAEVQMYQGFAVDFFSAKDALDNLILHCLLAPFHFIVR